AATLEVLGGNLDATVRAAVAGNPNAPLAVLLALAAQFPREVLDNPALPFLLLERPEFPATLPLEAASGLLRCEDVPRALLRPLATSADAAVRFLAALHVGLVAEPSAYHESAERAFMRIVSRLPDHEAQPLFELPGLVRPWLLDLLGGSADAEPHVPSGAKRKLMFRRTQSGFPAFEGVARCPDASPALLKRLATSPHDTVRARVAAHPRTPLAVLTQLASDRSSDVRIAVARSPRASLWVLHRLVKDPDHLVRRIVAHHPRLPFDLLRRQADDGDPALRIAAGQHAHTDADTLEMLADDWDGGVRSAVARNPRTPAPLLAYLLTDDDPGVRASLAQNPSVPAAVLAQLSRDDDTAVLDEAAQHPRLAAPDRARLTADPARHAALAANPRLSAPLLARWADSNDPQVRRAVAANPRTPVALLEQLAHDQDARRVAAANLDPPDAALEQLARDQDTQLRQALAHNPHTPFALVARLYPFPSLDQLQALARHPAFTDDLRAHLYHRWFDGPLCTQPIAALPRLILLASNLLPPATYETASASSQWVERYAIARNAYAPPVVLAALAHDGITHVRAAASATLAAYATPEAPA
ncbi:MAG TPA: HEAT repeat domain-containing protein, partial [Ktedonobacterales bacterium]